VAELEKRRADYEHDKIEANKSVINAATVSRKVDNNTG